MNIPNVNNTNIAAMKDTHAAYTSNVSAVKGEAYGKLMEKLTFVLASGDCVNYALRTGDKRQEACNVLSDMIARFVTVLSEECQVPPDQVVDCLEDARVMMEAVSEAAGKPIILQ